MAANAWGKKETKKKRGVKKPARPEKTTVDLGGGVKMEMTLIPAGEFMMGSGESAEATAEFFNKTYGEDFFERRLFQG